MAKQKIVWTALPHGRVEEGPQAGQLRVSIVVSPRLTPQSAAEQQLGAPGFQDFHNWPKTLQAAKFSLRVGGSVVPVEMLGQPDAALWDEIFPATTFVEGFVFKDMSQVNLRSFAVRNVVRFLRRHYGALATEAAATHPTLLPWRGAQRDLKGMLTELGTLVETVSFGDRSVDFPRPGFDRFFDERAEAVLERTLDAEVFSPQGRYTAPVIGIDGKPSKDVLMPVRCLPADWQNPAGKPPVGEAAVMGMFRSADEYTFYQANRFYHRTRPTEAQKRMRRPRFENVPPPPVEDPFDFHRIVASFADYPAVLRALGLIIDVVLPKTNPILSSLGNQAQADGGIGVDVVWSNGHNGDADAYPNTAWRVTAGRFVTRSRTSDHLNGLLRLEGAHDPSLVASPTGAKPGHSDFDVYQLDPDGAALKTTNFLISAQNLVGKSLQPGSHGEVTYTTGDKQAVAALRSGGLGVSRHGRAAEVALTAASAALKNVALEGTSSQSRNILLYVEDVIRGYRVDVRHADKWFSLCQREGDYRRLKSGKLFEAKPDEGYVKGASTSSDGGDDHYLHESLFRWTGWSLVAERPGRTIRATESGDGGLQGESVEQVDDVAAQGNGLAVRFRARKGTLPRLRFGQDYRFRARTVDLAGNSLSQDDQDLGALEQATEPVTYLRMEPVDPPAFMQRHRHSEGESLERMVLRSNFDRSPKDYLETPDFQAAIKDPRSADFAYVERNERHVVPPKSSQQQCELHGLFDAITAPGTPDAIKLAYALAAREAGTLFDPAPGSDIELVTPTVSKEVAQTSMVPPALPSSEHPTGERLVGGQYIVHREARLATPYLADGAAGGFALREHVRGAFSQIGITEPMVLGPDAVVVRAPNEELVLLVRYAKPWPDAQGLRIVLAERAHTLDDGPCEEHFPDDGRPHWDNDQRVLTLFLRKGHIARLRYSSFVDGRFIGQFALPRWTASSGQRKFVENMAMMGAHWMLTPYRPLVLVHATQQPVCTPRLQKVAPEARKLGDTFADLDASVRLHGASTGKFEVVAEWTEWVDDIRRDRPQFKHCTARLTEIPLPENAANSFLLKAMAEAHQPPPGNIFGGGNTPRLKGNRHEFGDTRFRLVTYRLEAATRFREYLPPALYEQTALTVREGPPALESMAKLAGEDDAGAPVLFNVPGATPNGTVIPSTAAPEVPRIVYVVPTFKWVQNNADPNAATQTSTRHGNGLRVYLERPWFSSGDGEQLGVVLFGEGKKFPSIHESMVPYVSQWGLDPLFDTELPKPMTRANDFAARVSSEAGIPLLDLEAGEPDNAVLVVGHRVQWDDDRQLWYADIELDAGAAYMPFVRLALVRYQPKAISGAKISRVAMAEFAQLLPRRRAVVKRTNNGMAVHVSLHGPVPDRGPMQYQNDSAHLNVSFVPPPGSVLESGRNKVALVLQTRDAAIDSDLAWEDVATLAEHLALPPGAAIDRVPGGIFAGAAKAAPETVTRTGVLGQPQTFATQLEITRPGPVFGGRTLDELADVLDPAVWEANVSLTAGQFAGKRARLVLREFERYYTDRTIPDKRGDQTYRKRVVEERLVYTEFFPLN